METGWSRQSQRIMPGKMAPPCFWPWVLMPTHVACFHPPGGSVVAYHHGDRYGGIVLSGYVAPIGGLVTGENLAGKDLGLGEFALRDSAHRQRVWTKWVESVERRPGVGIFALGEREGR